MVTNANLTGDSTMANNGNRGGRTLGQMTQDEFERHLDRVLGRMKANRADTLQIRMAREKMEGRRAVWVKHNQEEKEHLTASIEELAGVTTEDGYKFKRTEEGHLTDGDMTFTNDDLVDILKPDRVIDISKIPLGTSLTIEI